MTVPVNVYVFDDAPIPSPVEGVEVVLVSPTDYAFVAQAVTGADGAAAFVLPGSLAPGTSYEARAFKLGVAFKKPVLLKVIEPATVENGFVIVGTRVDGFGIPADPRLCRCSLRIMSISNRPLANKLVRIASKGDKLQRVPKIVDGNIIGTDCADYHTDPSGWLVVDLLRTGEYYLMYAGEEDEVWGFKVPDRASANLTDLIHPYPVSATWDPDFVPNNSLVIAKDYAAVISVGVLFSNFETFDSELVKWLEVETSDPTTVIAEFVSEGIRVRAVNPGQANISLSVKTDLYPKRYPGTPIVMEPLQITVT